MNKRTALGLFVVALMTASVVWYIDYTRPLTIDIAQLDTPPEGVWVCRGSFAREGGFEGSVNITAYIADGFVRAEFESSATGGRVYAIAKTGRAYTWNSGETYRYEGPGEGAFGPYGATGRTLACDKHIAVDDRLFELPVGRFETVASWSDIGGPEYWKTYLQ